MAEKGATQQAENRKRFKEILAVMKNTTSFVVYHLRSCSM